MNLQDVQLQLPERSGALEAPCETFLILLTLWPHRRTRSFQDL